MFAGEKKIVVFNKTVLIKQLFYSTFQTLADYNNFTLRTHLLFIS